MDELRSTPARIFYDRFICRLHHLSALHEKIGLTADKAPAAGLPPVRQKRAKAAFGLFALFASFLLVVRSAAAALRGWLSFVCAGCSFGLPPPLPSLVRPFGGVRLAGFARLRWRPLPRPVRPAFAFARPGGRFVCRGVAFAWLGGFGA